MTKFFTDEYFLPAKLSTDEYFLPTNISSRRIFFTRRFQITLFVFCLKLNALLDVKFRFLPYFMTENLTETERNAIIFVHFLVFYCVSTINFSKSLTLFQYLMDKKLSVKSIRRQKVTKFLASDESFYRRIFFADEIFHPNFIANQI